MSRWLWADIKGRVVNLDRVDHFLIEATWSDRWYVVAIQNGKRTGVFAGDTEAQCQEWLSRQLAYDDVKSVQTYISRDGEPAIEVIE